MKGVISSINPTVKIIDLTHQIPAQDIATARFQLMNAYPYFPEGTIHIAVVDPGVGSLRRSVAIQLEHGFLVAPDNGLVSGVLSQVAPIAAVELTNPQYWRIPNPSTTFHGRDIFAAVGAYLAKGLEFRTLGQLIDPKTLVQLPIPAVTSTADGVVGVIQAIDHFGNLISNIPIATIPVGHWEVRLNNREYPGGKTYSDVKPGEALALTGSHGWVEVAVNGGSGQKVLGVKIGQSIQMIIRQGFNSDR